MRLVLRLAAICGVLAWFFWQGWRGPGRFYGGLIGFIVIVTAADAFAGYIDDVETSQIPGTYCQARAGIASAGAWAQWLGVPLKFEVVSRARYHEMRAQGWKQPTDSIVVVADEGLATIEAWITWGYRWMATEGPLAQEPDWRKIINRLQEDCETMAR